MTDRDARHGAEGSAGGDARSIELTHALIGKAVEQSDHDAARRAAAHVSLDPGDAGILADVLRRRMEDCWARFDDAAEELAALHEVGVDELLFAVRRAVVRGNS
jgi:hypothetical protein